MLSDIATVIGIWVSPERLTMSKNAWSSADMLGYRVMRLCRMLCDGVEGRSFEDVEVGKLGRTRLVKSWLIDLDLISSLFQHFLAHNLHIDQ